MTRLGIAVAGLAALLGCSSVHDREIAARRNGEPSVEATRVDTGLTTLEESARTRTQPTKRSKLAASPAPAAAPAPAPAPRQAVTVADTDSVAAYAPDAAPVDTGAAGVIDTAPPQARSAPAAAPESIPAAAAPEPVRPAAAPEPVPPATPRAAARTLAVGTEIRATLDDSLDSRRDSAGKVVTARVADDVRGPDSAILIPAGSRVQLTVTRLEPARSKGAADGKVALRVDSISIGDRAQRVIADVRPIPHELRGRGVTAGEAEKVGVGAAGGAILGRVIGKNTKGAVIGGVVGAAGGAVVASQTASRDVVLRAQSPFTFVLTAPMAVRQ